MDFKRLLNIINSQPVLGGLEISGSALRFIKLKGDDLNSASLKLSPGIIEEGKIKDRSAFVSALSELHSQITGKKNKKIYTIVSVPDANVYTQAFNIPVINSANLQEAAQLNLQMISPIDFNNAYSDWQAVGENKTDGGQTEILGAFAPKEIINAFSGALEEAGFGAAAIEFSALSLARLAASLGVGVDAKNPCLLFRLGGEGLNFSVIRNKNLYFNHFEPWATVSKEQSKITLSDFKELIIREAQKVLNFYETHWGGKINKVFLISSGLVQETTKIFSENLSLEVQPLTLQKFSQLSPDWYVALSLALRGVTPRSQDTIISLASVGTEEEFQRYRLINFINIWRNVVLSSLVFMVAVFGLADWFLIKTAKSIDTSVDLTQAPGIVELKTLQEKAKVFNQKVETLLIAKQISGGWFPIFEQINNSVGQDIVLERVLIQSLEIPVLVNAAAVNQEAAINFKNVLAQQPQFYEVNLPLTNINVSADGSVKFNVSFRIR